MEPPTGQKERCGSALCSMPENNAYNKKAWRSWVEVSSRKLQRAQGSKKPAKPQEEQLYKHRQETSYQRLDGM